MHTILYFSLDSSEWSVQVVSAQRSPRSQNKMLAYVGNCSLTLECTRIHYRHSV